MLLLGCSPKGRHTEQHDVFFGIAPNLMSLVADIKAFWPEAGASIHIDAWRVVRKVGACELTVSARQPDVQEQQEKLFFINLGGYKANLFDETHFKVLTVQTSKAEAVKFSKSSDFFRTFTLKGAESHVDDKYGLDVDDLHDIEEILPAAHKSAYRLEFKAASFDMPEDSIQLGYYRLNKLSEDW